MRAALALALLLSVAPASAQDESEPCDGGILNVFGCLVLVGPLSLAVVDLFWETTCDERLPPGTWEEQLGVRPLYEGQWQCTGVLSPE